MVSEMSPIAQSAAPVPNGNDKPKNSNSSGDSPSFIDALSEAGNKALQKKDDKDIKDSKNVKDSNDKSKISAEIESQIDEALDTDGLGEADLNDEISTDIDIKKVGANIDGEIQDSILKKALSGEEIEEGLDDENPALALESDADSEDLPKGAKTDSKINPKSSDVKASAKSLTSKDIDKDLEQTKLDTNKKVKAEPDYKKLSDVKKEAQARNLNLQTIEVQSDGLKNKINPRDLVDRDILEANRERLSSSLQNKSAGVANTISRAISDGDKLLNKKEQMLAELLNRYDSAANAKRKAQNDAEKLEFKVGDGDRSMVIAREASQPKNIVESKFRNEVMQQEFLEELHNITGDEELGELVATNKARLQTSMQNFANNATALKDAKNVGAQMLQGWANQGQFVGQNEAAPFEFDTTKAFDEVLIQNLKTDPKEKEAEVIKDSKKIDDKPKEKGIDSKQEVASAQAKQEVMIKSALAKEAMKNFASQLREEILNYKPPITRINLELNPASLGQVSLSITKKGKDLQVNITSNQNVMTMFVQNAQELRQNLMQIGFNNLDLNFGSNDNKHGPSQDNQPQDDSEDNNMTISSLDEAEAMLESGNIPSSMNVILPDYA